MAASADSRIAPPNFVSDEKVHRRAIATWALQANQGHLANTGSLTLNANTTSSVYLDSRVGPFSWIGLMPLTVNAATEFGAGTLHVKTRGKQTFTLKHVNNIQTDRNFRYAILG